MSIALYDQIQQLRAELTTHTDQASIVRIETALAHAEALHLAEREDFELWLLDTVQ